MNKPRYPRAKAPRPPPQASASLQEPASGFSYSRPFFEELVDRALAHAKKLGATDAGAEASEGCGLSVSVRKGELENVERNRDKSLGVTVYIGHRRGNASTSDFSEKAIEQTVQAAYDIARFTAEDPAAGLPDADDIAPPETHRDLDLFHPWAITSEEAAEMAKACEAAAFKHAPPHHQQRRRGRVGPAKPFLQRPHARAFAGGYASSRHSFSVGAHRLAARQERRDAARCLVQLHAQCGRPGLARGRGPLRRAARA